MTSEIAATAGTESCAPVTLSVIAPCLNEEGNVGALVERTLATFDALAIRAELVIVDDGSTDATWARVTEEIERDPRVRGVRLTSNGGIENAWRVGFNHCDGHLVCLIDADLQNRPEDIAKLYKTYLREVPDVVQAVRHPTRDVRRCRLFSRGLNIVLNLTFGTRLRDNKSGFILTRRDALVTILRHRFTYRYFQSFIGVAACARGLRIAEVDTDFDQRNAGRSFLSRFPILVSLRIVWELCKFRVEIARAAAPAPAGSRWSHRPLVADPTQGEA